jgi:hypothetical protein
VGKTIFEPDIAAEFENLFIKKNENIRHYLTNETKAFIEQRP